MINISYLAFILYSRPYKVRTLLNFGYAFLGLLCFAIGANLTYLIPLKIIEVYGLIKKLIKHCKKDQKVAPKTTAVQNLNKSVNSRNSAFKTNTDNECIIEAIPKWKRRILDRNKKALNESKVFTFRKQNHFSQFQIEDEKQQEL